MDAAAARGISKAELQRRTGLSLSTIYSLSKGSQPSAKAISALMQVFPDLPYERLFIPAEAASAVPAISRKLDVSSSGPKAEVAA